MLLPGEVGYVAHNSTEHLIVGKRGNRRGPSLASTGIPVSMHRAEDTASSRMSHMCSWQRTRSAQAGDVRASHVQGGMYRATRLHPNRKLRSAWRHPKKLRMPINIAGPLDAFDSRSVPLF
jgi:hypothetical protein